MRLFIPILFVCLALAACDSKKTETAPAPTPPPVVKPILEGPLDFPETAVGEKSSKTLSIKNPGTTHLNVIAVSYPEGFTGEAEPFSVDPGATREIEIFFSPEKAGNYITIKSPMIGTFYRSSGPGKPPFVNVGDEIKAGKPVCIIEAMKLFNEIESEMTGTIVKVLVEDGTSVEYDQPLFLVQP
jgi:acetyl-CoA carboxylase biotin carboxyl carrier protein